MNEHELTGEEIGKLVRRLREEARFGWHIAANRQADTRNLHAEAADAIDRLLSSLKQGRGSAAGAAPLLNAYAAGLASELEVQAALVREMAKALEITRMQLRVHMAGKNALSNEEHLSIVEAALSKQEGASEGKGQGTDDAGRAIEARVILQSWVNAEQDMAADELSEPLRAVQDRTEECFRRARDFLQRTGPVTPNEAREYRAAERRRGLEEAAKVAAGFLGTATGNVHYGVCQDIAIAIRALIPPSSGAVDATEEQGKSRRGLEEATFQSKGLQDASDFAKADTANTVRALSKPGSITSKEK